MRNRDRFPVRSDLAPFLFAAGAVIGLSLFLASCFRQSTATSIQQAGLLVVHGDGAIEQSCIRFPESSISGYEVLQRSGLSLIVDPRNTMGILVCSVDGEGCSFPQVDCLCACRGMAGCTYWAYFTHGPDGAWTYSPVGASARRVSDGDLDAWVWLSGTGPAGPESPPLPDIDVDDVCGPAGGGGALSPTSESR
ncbi:MAG: hypothetical protein AB1449_05720 [Chloroflexota bacterium]